MSEKFTYNQMTEQQDSGIHQPTVLVRRSSGAIETAAYTGVKDEHGHYYVELNQKGANGESYMRGMTAEDLTDEGQARLAQELAEGAARSPEAWERVGKVEKEIADTALEDVGIVAPAVPQESANERVRPRVDLKVENIERGVRMLEQVSGGELGELFKGSPEDAAVRRSLIDPNDGDPELRRKLEVVLRKRIDEIGYQQKLPERVQRNDPGDLKNIPSDRFGYEKDKYSPREYAAKVALAMLDGSFNGDPQKLDYTDLSANDPRNGQHRQTARMVLESFAEQKRQEQQSSPEEQTEENGVLGEVKSILRRLNEDEDLTRTEYLLRDLDEEFGRGLPNIIDTDQVTYQLHTYESQLRVASEAIHDTLAKIASLSGDIKPSDQAAFEEIQRNTSSAHYQLESARQMIGMLASKVDELAYDQGAQLEVRSLFIQQLPQAVHELQRALHNVRWAVE